MRDEEGIGIRAAEKNNYPNVFVSWSVFGVAADGEYSDVHCLPRLEARPVTTKCIDCKFEEETREYALEP